MEPELYYQLVRYLANGEVPKGVDSWRRNLILRSRNNFEYTQNKLYKIFPKDEHSYKLVISGRNKYQVLKTYHDHHLSGHQGVERTYQQIRQKFWWPNMMQDVQQHIRTCDKCQKRQGNQEHIPLAPVRTPTEPFQHIGIDILGPLPLTKSGKRYIILAVD